MTTVAVRATPADRATCAHCGEPHAHPAFLALHVGREHGATMDAHEREAYERALAEEETELARLRVHARAFLKTSPLLIGALVLMALIFGSGANAGFAFMLIPVTGFLFAVVYLVAIAMSET